MGFSIWTPKVQRDLTLSLAKTGTIPDNPFWAKLEDRREINPTRFDRYHPFIGALIRRDIEINAGKLCRDSPLFYDKHMFMKINERFEKNPHNFTHYHPLLGKVLSAQASYVNHFKPPCVVPEPATAVLWSIGFALIFVWHFFSKELDSVMGRKYNKGVTQTTPTRDEK
jgi:hypothetical protein